MPGIKLLAGPITIATIVCLLVASSSADSKLDIAGILSLNAYVTAGQQWASR